MELQPRVPHSVPRGQLCRRCRAFAGGAPSGRAGARRSGRLLFCTGGGRAVGRACHSCFPSQKIAAGRVGTRARLLPMGLPRQTARGGPKIACLKRRTPPGSRPHIQRRAPYAASACAAPGELSVKHFTLLYLTAKKRVFPAKSPLFLYYSFYIIQIVFFHPPVSCTGAYGFTPPHTPFRPAPPARGGGPPAFQRRKGRRTRAPARSERPYAAQCSWRQRRYR